MEQKPSIGRIVHYQYRNSPSPGPDSVTRPAIVVALREELAGSVGGVSVDLAVFNPSGLIFQSGVAYDADGTPETWRWPPRT